MKTQLRKMKVTLAGAALAAMVTGSVAQAAGNGFDVNDLNILFASDANGKLIPEIEVSDVLLAPSLFNDVQVQAGKLGIGTPAQNDAEKAQISAPGGLFHVGSDKKQWRVMSLRYDSCFPAVPLDDNDTKNCIEHVRLIAQPISPRRQNGEDTTMHLLYAVQGLVKTPAGTFAPQTGKALKSGDDKNPATVIGQLRALKTLAKQLGVETNGTALGVHPALANPASQAQFAAAVQQFIARNCSTDKLMVITYMGLQGRGPEPWIFFGGNANTTRATVDPRVGRWEVDFQPTTGPNQDKNKVPQPGSDAIVFSNINQPNMDGKNGKVVPHPHSVLDLEGSEANVARLFDDAPTNLDAAAKNVVNLLENPKIHAPHNTDCFSCHATNTQARSKVIPAVVPTGPTKEFLVKDGITAYVERDVQPSTSWNTRNFGYFGGKPSVSYLTALSAGDVAHFTNKQLGLTNPGVTCGTQEKQVALRNCTMFGGAGGAPQTLVQCMAANQCGL